MDGSFEPTISPARLRAQARQLERETMQVIRPSEIRDLRRTLVTVRSDFKMPAVKTCCGVPMYPVAYNDCGEIACFLVCDRCGDVGDDIPWPFNESRAWDEDFERLGFRCE